MKITIALLLLIVPWAVFVLLASVERTSTFGLVLTLAVSAWGFNMLMGRKPKAKK